MRSRPEMRHHRSGRSSCRGGLGGFGFLCFLPGRFGPWCGGGGASCGGRGGRGPGGRCTAQDPRSSADRIRHRLQKRLVFMVGSLLCRMPLTKITRFSELQNPEKSYLCPRLPFPIVRNETHREHHPRRGCAHSEHPRRGVRHEQNGSCGRIRTRQPADTRDSIRIRRIRCGRHGPKGGGVTRCTGRHRTRLHGEEPPHIAARWDRAAAQSPGAPDRIQPPAAHTPPFGAGICPLQELRRDAPGHVLPPLRTVCARSGATLLEILQTIFRERLPVRQQGVADPLAPFPPPGHTDPRVHRRKDQFLCPPAAAVHVHLGTLLPGRGALHPRECRYGAGTSGKATLGVARSRRAAGAPGQPGG